jgi:hypothetical protein
MGVALEKSNPDASDDHRNLLILKDLNRVKTWTVTEFGNLSWRTGDSFCCALK